MHPQVPRQIHVALVMNDTVIEANWSARASFNVTSRNFKNFKELPSNKPVHMWSACSSRSVLTEKFVNQDWPANSCRVWYAMGRICDVQFTFSYDWIRGRKYVKISIPCIQQLDFQYLLQGQPESRSQKMPWSLRHKPSWWHQGFYQGVSRWRVDVNH